MQDKPLKKSDFSSDIDRALAAIRNAGFRRDHEVIVDILEDLRKPARPVEPYQLRHGGLGDLGWTRWR